MLIIVWLICRLFAATAILGIQADSNYLALDCEFMLIQGYFKYVEILLLAYQSRM